MIVRVFFAAILLAACSGGFRSMSWNVDCDTDTPRTLYERYHEEYAYKLCDPLDFYESCPAHMASRYRYEWAKADYQEQCEL